MALRLIVKYPDPVLLTPTRPVGEITAAAAELDRAATVAAPTGAATTSPMETPDEQNTTA